MTGATVSPNLNWLFVLICFAGTVAYTGPYSTLSESAELPHAYVRTSLSDTPATGAILRVKDADEFKQALERAACGDTIELEAGSTYTGSFRLPAKPCNDAHWILIRTSSPDSSLPAEGVRITPCYAGISSLPGRPAFPCGSASSVMARIAGAKGENRIISNAEGANHYRFLGVEIADGGANGTAGGFFDLVFLDHADHIIFDRCWLHGTATGEDVKGIDFEHSSDIAVVDSYISDIHSKTSGYGADSSAIGSLSGVGPVKISNNYLEAAGVSVLWGGGAAETNVSDIEFRHNYVFKPLIWWKNSSNYFGTEFTVKNLYETKNSVRELIEGNIFENNWRQSQDGTAILLYPKNQFGACPSCIVHDVTFRYNIVRHVANAMIIVSTKATTCRGEPGNITGSCSFISGPVYNVSIVNNLFDDVNEQKYEGGCCMGGTLWEIGTDQPSSLPHDITIEHNTGLPSGSGIANVILTPPEFIDHFVFRNNLVGSGDYGFRGLVLGRGNRGCADADGALGTLQLCFHNTWIFDKNVIVDNSKKGISIGEPYPKTPHCGALPSCTQFYPKHWKDVGFVNFNDGNGGDYHLQPASRYYRAGTDGKDVGADMDALTAAVAGVAP
jgi:hypothetical protein